MKNKLLNALIGGVMAFALLAMPVPVNRNIPAPFAPLAFINDGAAWAADLYGFAVKPVILLASAARTASANGSAVSTTIRSSSPVSGAVVGFTNKFALVLDVTVLTGATQSYSTPGIIGTLQGRECSTCTYVTLGATTKVSTVSATVANVTGPLPPEVRGQMISDQGASVAMPFTASLRLKAGG